MSHTTDTNRRFTVPISTINDKDRIRKDYGDIAELAESIKQNGLLQPIVITLNGLLIAGGRRLRAMRTLGWQDIPVTYFEVADEITLRILEVEENVRRKAMSWQERVLAIADVHNKQLIYKNLKGEQWTQTATGELLGESQSNVSYALSLATYIRQGDKEIEKCPRLWDAIHLLVKRGAEESNKLLAKLTIPTVSIADAKKMLADVSLDDTDIFTNPSGPSSGSVAQLQDDGEMPGAVPSPADAITIPLSQMCLRQEGNGDRLDVIISLPDASIDHIITDWPYAIDMDNIDQANDGKSVESTSAEHGVLANKTLQQLFIKEAYRLLKPNGFFITWTDISVWQENYDRAIAAGFSVQRWPLVWHKTHRCANQMALYNFTKDYEIAIVCRKNNATLLTPQASSIYMGATDEQTRSLAHPFAKPSKLWKWLYDAVAHKGQLVLDPFAGVGSSTLAAIEHGIQPLAIECNEKHYAQLIVNVSEHYKKNLKNVKFI